MKSITKLFVPAVLALAAIGAQAAVTEIDYPTEVIQSRVITAGDSAGAAVGTSLNIMHSESAVQDTPALNMSTTTRDEVRARIGEPTAHDTRYFN